MVAKCLKECGEGTSEVAKVEFRRIPDTRLVDRHTDRILEFVSKKLSVDELATAGCVAPSWSWDRAALPPRIILGETTRRVLSSWH